MMIIEQIDIVWEDGLRIGSHDHAVWVWRVLTAKAGVRPSPVRLLAVRCGLSL
jgi:hypothetical protein